MLNIVTSGKTDVGLKRTNNEDSFFADPEAGVCVVADGMGGAAAGELASGIFAQTAKKLFHNSRDRDDTLTRDLVQAVFQKANEKILEHVDQNPDHKGMGCTAELIAFSDSGGVLGHIGDSRTYRFRNQQLKQITRDHSLVQEQVDQGQITAEEAMKHPLRNIILRAVGIQGDLALDLVKINPRKDDIFLLCSDGLTDMVPDESIRTVLNSNSDLDEMGEKLVDLAKFAGGKDNITIVLCRVT